MIAPFVNLFLFINKLLLNNLGLTIIVIGVVSRAIFYPFFANSIRYSKAMRDLKPQLDAVKKKHAGDMRKQASEQSRLFKEAGVSPAASLIGCLSMIVQIVVFILLFQAITRVIGSGVETHFLVWDLAKPDAYKITGLPLDVPGILVVLTAVLSFIQSKMLMAPPTQTVGIKGSRKEPEKGSISDALSATQSQTAYIIPIVILISGTHFAAGLALYWLVSTIFGIIQQYYIGGTGGLEPWLVKLKIKK
ncbi:MAG: YidC/Oxa1 family membrane protein insertase [bacterium]|nr:YidC/Oxa1 family membrane protein insertase [bacterium]